MNKFIWCLGVTNGLEVIEPNSNLAEAYSKKAESALESMRLVRSQDWIITTAYYSMYFSLYAILMKIGVKCENHACTLAFIKEMLKKYYSEEEVSFLEKSMQARVDKQYYTDREVAGKQSDDMMKRAPEFVIKGKEIILRLTEKERQDMRTKIIKIREENKKGKKK